MKKTWEFQNEIMRSLAEMDVQQRGLFSESTAQRKMKN